MLAVEGLCMQAKTDKVLKRDFVKEQHCHLSTATRIANKCLNILPKAIYSNPFLFQTLGRMIRWMWVLQHDNAFFLFVGIPTFLHVCAAKQKASEPTLLCRHEFPYLQKTGVNDSGDQESIGTSGKSMHGYGAISQGTVLSTDLSTDTHAYTQTHIPGVTNCYLLTIISCIMSHIRTLPGDRVVLWILILLPDWFIAGTPHWVMPLINPNDALIPFLTFPSFAISQFVGADTGEL